MAPSASESARAVLATRVEAILTFLGRGMLHGRGACRAFGRDTRAVNRFLL